jgi:hypothetical protein
VLFVTNGEQHGRSGAGDGERRGGQRGCGTPARLDAQRQPEQAGAEQKRHGEGNRHTLGAAHFRHELRGDLAGLRETAGLLLGEDDLVVHRDLEDASGSLDELSLDAELLLDLFRQTGGARIVVSDGAVLDDDVRGHTLLLSAGLYGTAYWDSSREE